MFHPNDLNYTLLLVVLWESIWKGLGLWRAAKRGELIWFVAILIINLFGIVPIFYLWKSKQLDETVADVLTFLRIKK